MSGSLESLDISGNLIDFKGSKAICEAVLINKRVTHVDLRFNSFDGKTKELIKETESSRKGLKLEA